MAPLLRSLAAGVCSARLAKIQAVPQASSRYAWASMLLLVCVVPVATARAQDEELRERDRTVEPQEDENRGRLFDRERDTGFREDADSRGGRTREAGESADAELRVIPAPGRPGPRRWTLGVYADPVDVGYRVNGVLSGSPAARVGIEPGDVIVAVDGYQVGRVGRHFYPLSRELQNRAGDSEVTLLVRNVRNGRLLNLDVDFRRDRPRAPYMRNRLFDERARGSNEDRDVRSEAAEEPADIRGRGTGELQ